MSDETPEDPKPTRALRAIGGKTKSKKRDSIVHAGDEFARKAFVDDIAMGHSDEHKDVAERVFDSLSMGERLARYLFKRDPTVDEIVRCAEMVQNEFLAMEYEDFQTGVLEDDDGDTG